MHYKDYRNTLECSCLEEVGKKKKQLEKVIRDKHKKVEIFYYSIKYKKGEYFNLFAEIYNHKCAYCGVANIFRDIHLFEVDHFVCESAFEDSAEGRAKAGKVSNLVLSCYSCNRGKTKLHIKDKHKILLNPDDNSIAQVFFRDDDYYIRINDDFLQDDFIQSFYEHLSFESETKRIDFLLLEMNNLISKVQDKNSELADKLGNCVRILMQKKNCTYS